MKGREILLGSGKLTAVGPYTPLNNSAASHERVGGVAGVGMCFMDTLAQLLRDGSHVKGLVLLSEQLFSERSPTRVSCWSDLGEPTLQRDSLVNGRPGCRPEALVEVSEVDRSCFLIH